MRTGISTSLRVSETPTKVQSIKQPQTIAAVQPDVTIQLANAERFGHHFSAIDIQRPDQPQSNQTGLPDSLKSGVESLSGYALDSVRVHYRSDKPAALGALAYTQGTEIHVAPGQERHLPHEAWHVVQQAQGRVRPTIQAKGIPINDDHGLEREADQMGQQAARQHPASGDYRGFAHPVFGPAVRQNRETVIQRISESNARSQLKVLGSDEAAKPAVTILVLINKIIDQIPALEAILGEFDDFAEAHRQRPELSINHTYLKKWLGPLVKFALDKTGTYIEILEGIEEWYVNASPVERNKTAAENLDSWVSEQAQFSSKAAKINALFAIRDTAISPFSEEFNQGNGALSAIKKMITDWTSTGGGFSAVGRAHDIEAEVIKRSKEPENDDLTRDSTFLKLISVGGTKLAGTDGTHKVYKQPVTEDTSGPVVVEGFAVLNPESVSKRDRTDKLVSVERLISDELTTSQSGNFKAPPAGKDRGAGQYTSMGLTNARGYAWLLDLPGWSTSQWEWLHLRAASLGGSTDGTNLVVGTRDANTHMIPFESNVRALANLVKQHKTFKHLKISWKADRKHSHAKAKHAYKYLSIGWELETTGTIDVPDGVTHAKGMALFDTFNTDSMISKTEVRHLEQVLKKAREKVLPDEG